MTASQITVRNVEPGLFGRLRTLSAARGESLNTTVLRLLRKAVEAHPRRERLRRYATWTDEDHAEFERALRAQRTVDHRDWR